MLDRLDSFLPSNINEARVVESLPVPGYPAELLPYLPSMDEINERVEPGRYNPHEYAEFRKSFGPRMTGEVDCGGAAGMSRLCFVNKHTLHTLLDSMIMTSDRVHVSSVDGLPSEVLSAILRLALAFTSFVQEREFRERYGLGHGRLLMAYKYDQFPGDREGLMKYKRFHVPLNFFDEDILRRMRASRHAYGAVGSLFKRRRLVDPSTFVTTRVLYECLKSHLDTNDEFVLREPSPERDVQEGLGFGLRISLLDGWSALGTGAIDLLLMNIHRWFLQCYEDIYEALCGCKYAPRAWYRPSVLRGPAAAERLARIAWLTPETADELNRFFSRMRDLDGHTLRGFRVHKRSALTNMIMGGPMYTVSIVDGDTVGPSGQRPVELVLNAKLFSAIGGAGLFGMDGASAVRISRGTDGVLSADEIARREGFQADFMRYACDITGLACLPAGNG